MSNKHTISVLVENEFGVLARVSGMFAARGFNIDSLSVAPTLDPHYSHMTLVTTGSEEIVEQILKQLNRLIDVVKVEDLAGENFVNRQTILVKLEKTDLNNSKIMHLADRFHCKIIEISSSAVILEFTGEDEEAEEFLLKLEPFEILELVRTGTIALHRGSAHV